jgi:FdhD protein
MQAMEPTMDVQELPFRIEVNGRVVLAWSCSPGAWRALALGRLVGEGYAAAAEPPPALAEATSPAGTPAVRTTLPAERVAAVEAERRHQAEHGCGLLHHVRCAPPGERVPGTGRLPDAAALERAFRALFQVGGPGRHAAAVAGPDGALWHATAAAGRHDAVDTAIGAALLAGEALASLGLVTTSRVSGTMALHAARAGVAWVASRSLATTLALEIATAAGLPVITRAASPERRVRGGGGGGGAPGAGGGAAG